MKKALSVILAFILMFGICAVCSSAVDEFDLSFKSGDVVGPSLNANGKRVDFNADTDDPISGGINSYFKCFLYKIS